MLLAMLLVGFLAAGCEGAHHGPTGHAASPSPTMSPVPSARYSGEELSFSYPAGWRPATYQAVSSFTRSIVDLSNQAMHSRCTSRTTKSGTTTVCGWPLGRLARNGVLVSWEADGFPGWTLEHAPGTSIRVDGLPARWDVSAPGDCRELGARETVTVHVARSIANNYYLMRACLAGPQIAVSEAQVRQMIGSTTFKQR